VALWLLGYPDQAERQSEAAIRMSRTLSPASQAVALHFAAMLHQLRRDPARACACAEEVGAIAVEHRFSFWLAGANILAGWSTARLGATAIGAEQLRRGLFQWQSTDSVTYQTYYLGLLADVLGDQGDATEPLRVLHEALALARQTGEGLYEAELHRLRGALLLRDAEQSPATRVQDAEQAFCRAIEIAQKQEAKSLELRAAMDLAQLLRDQGQFSPAREMLGRALAQFTEGSDTPDLRAAAELLAEIAERPAQ